MESDSVLETCDDQNETEDAEFTEVKRNNSAKPQSIIPQKKQPAQLCNCPLHCDTKIGKEWREKLYQQFGELGDHAWQNQFIQRHIKIKSIAKRLWEDEVIDKKIQRRVTCKYLIPLNGSVKESYSYSKSLDYDSVKFALDTSVPDNTTKGDTSSNGVSKENDNPMENIKNGHNDMTMEDVNCNGDTIMEPDLNGETNLSTKENNSDVNSPMSFNDSESINTADESNISEFDNSTCSNLKYVEVCQKAFMNMYGITEKRIRWQREKLILRSRYLAEKKKKELEEMDRTLSLARSLGAGCQPLFALLENSNCKQLSEQLLVAIEDDVMLVNNFFHNQLWKPEDIMNKSVHFSALDSCEAECD